MTFNVIRKDFTLNSKSNFQGESVFVEVKSTGPRSVLILWIRNNDCYRIIYFLYPITYNCILTLVFLTELFDFFCSYDIYSG